jgi:DNA-binding HxlR family transcriptional regulator
MAAQSCLVITAPPYGPPVWPGGPLQQSLGMSRKVLAERLRWLTEAGVLERREYSARPPRHEYVLTAKGLELFEVLMVMVAWGDKWLAGEAGPPVLYRHHACGQIIAVTCGTTGGS